MATKTSKRAGETTTTVSVGIRIDPKIKFALDIMGRLQKRSLTAVIEWAISNAITQQNAGVFNTSLSEVVDSIWSTDEATRFIKLCYELPEALTYDELRTWETIKATPYFWNNYRDGTSETILANLSIFLVRDNWEDIKEHVATHKSSPSIVPIGSDILVPF